MCFSSLLGWSPGAICLPSDSMLLMQMRPNTKVASVEGATCFPGQEPPTLETQERADGLNTKGYSVV